MKVVKITKYTTAIAVLLSIMAAAILIVLFNEKDQINLAQADANIELTKTPSQTTVSAGTTVFYTYVITNKSNNIITNINLSDDKITIPPANCSPNITDPLPAGNIITCWASMVINETTTNIANVTGQMQPAVGADTIPVSAEASATVVVPPSFTISKTANPTTVTEEGTLVTYTVTITNDARQNLSLTSLTDDPYGDLAGKGTCSIPQTILPGEFYSCTFTEIVPCDESPSLTDTVTATGEFDDFAPIEKSASATVNVACEEPSMEVTKTATPASITEDTEVDYEINITNNLGHNATLSILDDDIYGNLNNQGDCTTGSPIADGATYTCNFPGEVTCEDSPSLTDTVTVKLTYTDDDGAAREASDSASATVRVACEEEPYCGDGNLNSGEECDDGNNIDGDGCSATCTNEEGQVEPGLATIHGKVYNDSNQNRTLDVAENGLNNVTVTLLDDNNAILESDQTDPNGDFSFAELDPGTYALRETDPTGYLSSTSNDITGITVQANDSSYHLFGDYMEEEVTPTPTPTPTPTATATPTTTSALPTTGPGDNPYPLFAGLALIPLLAAGYAFYSLKRKK